MENLNIIGYIIDSRVDERGHQASGMFGGSDIVREILDLSMVNIKQNIDWWTTQIKYVAINSPLLNVYPPPLKVLDTGKPR